MTNKNNRTEPGFEEDRAPCLRSETWGTQVSGSAAGWTFESCLVHGHHVDVGFAFAAGDALLVDLGPAEAEEQALDGGPGLAGSLAKAIGFFGSQGPAIGFSLFSGFCEATAHGGDIVAAVGDSVSTL